MHSFFSYLGELIKKKWLSLWMTQMMMNLKMKSKNLKYLLKHVQLIYHCLLDQQTKFHVLQPSLQEISLLLFFFFGPFVYSTNYSDLLVLSK